ncbi:hypothetical protein BU15DRAFT_68308 [Melanogaster broomeanus]|nr:hypothetical protein BU15DRAFT_68308 [Melanogaster broomeanus]
MHTYKPPDLFSGDTSAPRRGAQAGVWNQGEMPMDVEGHPSPTISVDMLSPSDQVAIDTSDSDEFEDAFISVDVDKVQNAFLEVQPSGGDLHSDDIDNSDNESLYTDCASMITEIPDVVIDQMDATSTQERPDLSLSIDGMYRILDLINEQGTGGLVEKVIIAQDSLRDFVNNICPGVYVSMTKVNFKTLDQYIVKPIGVYGSKDEIVRFLLSIGRVDDNMAQELLRSTTNPASLEPTLRSGLYVLRHLRRQGDEELFVIYWPEDTTWNDSASSSVCRNRVTFMRYLTKMCDQLMALISSEHAKAMVWNMDRDEYLAGDEDGYSRLVTFEVSKTNEQEESVIPRPGFQVSSGSITETKFPGDCPLDASLFKPRLLFGETTQGFLTLTYQPARTTVDRISKATYNRISLGSLLKDVDLQINESLDERGLEILLEAGLEARFSGDCREFKSNVEVLKRTVDAQMKTEISNTSERIEQSRGFTSKIMHDEVVKVILGQFPTLKKEELGLGENGENGEAFATTTGALEDLYALYPDLRSKIQEEVRKIESDTINIRSGDFKKCKKKICFIYGLWSEMQGWHEGHRGQSRIQSLLKKAETLSFHGDPEFVASLDDILCEFPSLEELVHETQLTLNEHLKKIIPTRSNKLTHMTLDIQQQTCTAQVKREIEMREEKELCDLRKGLIRVINGQLQKSRSSRRLLSIDSVEDITQRIYHTYPQFSLSGTMEHSEDQFQQYTIHLMALDRNDRHELQLNPSFMPTPRFHQSHKFRLPPDFVISRAQLLEDEKILLAVTDRVGNSYIYYENLTTIDNALARKTAKQMHGGKVGQNFILAFDESKRMLCVVATSKLQLHIFVYDDGRKSMQARGTEIHLSKWYQEEIYPCHACFICGTEELLLIDTQAHARVFSLVTLQFRKLLCLTGHRRPAVLDLKQIPVSVYSSPDAYHWSTFGTTEGILLEVPQLQADDSLCLTSLINKNAVHLVRLDVAGHRCDSIALDITRKVTEFMFKEKGTRTAKTNVTNVTAHNSLIDCHADVWARFPVVPAVRRETITSESLRKSKSIVFVTDRDQGRYSHHFSDIIATFERTTKKPGGDALRKIAISGSPFSVALDELQNAAEWSVSQFLAGEWIVEFLCLIPIHIAVTKENRFVPLKDGVYSTALERSLLGADVNRIVDSLSFGWYESIFQSYMATKPVKVVSSMGEQSVGKSFALNHLVDTSFAGSAMRTTEGVWMSVTPTKDALIVALDFEGVHSIERSAQEDTLLVLFNTAISNLVLFRNNFALSRDITGLFQSFQSSSTVLDPGENPSLFNSTLMIIIKDVVDSDTKEIVREFQLKFQKIVQDEQGSNFITRLHKGQLGMLPWPVIESREFYKQFSVIKKRLDHQQVTHNAAGEFLHLMKTLMAKLKANDWGACPEGEPEVEPLKTKPSTYMTRATISSWPQGTLRTHARERTLSVLRATWGLASFRQRIPEPEWVDGLSQHLRNHCQHAHLTMCLLPAAVTMSVKQTILVSTNASSVSTIPNTKDALCPLVIPGKHIELSCVVDAHLCGQQCSMLGKSGCLEKCIKMMEHPDGDHECAATMHACGEPCDLAGIRLADGTLYSCPQRCHIARTAMSSTTNTVVTLAFALSHVSFANGSVQMSTTCMAWSLEQLTFAGHQPHACESVCSARGICEIETAPHSIEATFTGKHETFQYTKFSQVSKRLKCVKVIPPNEIQHVGSHTHSLNHKVVHFCKARCDYCGYFCTLPLGHAQQEHETRHGSMSQTRWAIDGPEDASLEIEGRRFSSNDEGAPMMCNLVCQAMGRHPHISYCRADDPTACNGDDQILHIHTGLSPNPAKPKDFVTHSLFWQRTGFKDPYSREEQTNFAKCGSDDSIFVIDKYACSNNLSDLRLIPCHRSSSMTLQDRRPLRDTPASARIIRHSDNRFGAVLSSLYSFLLARDAAVNAGGRGVRRDTYSVILFDELVTQAVFNDLGSTADQLLDTLLHYRASGWTDFGSAIQTAQSVMQRGWSMERTPVIIFLSDGECPIEDQIVQSLCMSATQLGKALSFHAVSFGHDNYSSTLRRMTEIALEAQRRAPRDPMLPAEATVLSSYNEALDTVQLAETFLGIAQSLSKPRGSLMI